MKQTKRPLIIKQSMVEKSKMLEDIRLAEEQMSWDKGIPHKVVKNKFSRKH